MSPGKHLGIPLSAEPPVPEPPAPLDPRPPIVALCEPDGQLLTLFAEWLQRAGFAASGCAPPGSSAGVAVVVADVPMPPRAGAERVAALRRRFPHARVLAISSRFTPGLEGATAAATTLGVDAVLAKPFSCDQFIAQVRTLTRIPGKSSPPEGKQ